MQKLIFLGDSVTDCARKRSDKFLHLPESLGKGWVSYVAKKLSARQEDFLFWNRGYSGCLVEELMQKEDWWPDDESQTLHANLATVMIGINDVWHPFWKNKPHDIEKTLNALESLVLELKARANQVVVCEPIALPCGEVGQDWWPVLDELTEGQAALTKKLDVHWLPLQNALMKTSQGKPEDYLHDGVHPTDLGHRWLSSRWLQYVLDENLIKT